MKQHFDSQKLHYSSLNFIIVLKLFIVIQGINILTFILIFIIIFLIPIINLSTHKNRK